MQGEVQTPKVAQKVAPDFLAISVLSTPLFHSCGAFCFCEVACRCGVVMEVVPHLLRRGFVWRLASVVHPCEACSCVAGGLWGAFDHGTGIRAGGECGGWNRTGRGRFGNDGESNGVQRTAHADPGLVHDVGVNLRRRHVLVPE